MGVKADMRLLWGHWRTPYNANILAKVWVLVHSSQLWVNKFRSEIDQRLFPTSNTGEKGWQLSACLTVPDPVVFLLVAAAHEADTAAPPHPVIFQLCGPCRGIQMERGMNNHCAKVKSDKQCKQNRVAVAQLLQTTVRFFAPK